MTDKKEKRGILFIISAPSGAGKTTIVKALCERDPNLVISVSHTTRPRRPDEIEDVSYHFIDETTFHNMLLTKSFLEHATVFDHHYGTSMQWVEEQLDAGVDVILEIDWQGALQVRTTLTDTIDIFILPPSYQSLVDRLNSRGEDKKTVDRRMRDATIEISHFHEYEYIVINENLEQAITEIQTIINAARLKYVLQKPHYDNFVHLVMEQSENIE